MKNRPRETRKCDEIVVKIAIYLSCLYFDKLFFVVINFVHLSPLKFKYINLEEICIFKFYPEAKAPGDGLF